MISVHTEMTKNSSLDLKTILKYTDCDPKPVDHLEVQKITRGKELCQTNSRSGKTHFKHVT